MPRTLAGVWSVAMMGVIAIGATAPPVTARAERHACALSGNGVFSGEGHSDTGSFVRSTGRVEAAMLFVDFSDAQAHRSPGSYYERLVPEATTWFRRSSYDRFRLRVRPLRRWLRLPAPSASYAVVRGGHVAGTRALMRDAIAAADPHFDFARSDLVYVVATRGSAVEYSPAYLGGPRGAFEVDGNKIMFGAVFGNDLDEWSSAARVLEHETGHVLGLPDLYGHGSHDPEGGFVGMWDVMSSLGGPGADVLGWHKWKLGWLESNQVACVTRSGPSTYELSRLGRAEGLKIVAIRTGRHTALVAENRLRGGNDSDICSEGVLVYEVNSAVASGQGPIILYQRRTSIAEPACGALSDSVLKVGESVTDPDSGVKIEVVSSKGSVARVRIRKPSATELLTNSLKQPRLSKALRFLRD